MQALVTVPDTQDDILWDKIGKSIGVYSGVYEYTQQIQEQIQSIQSIQGILGFAVSCRQDSCSVMSQFLYSEFKTKVFICNLLSAE